MVLAGTPREAALPATRSWVARRYLAVMFASLSVLALEVIFTRIFSIMIWYHFAYLVIGVALLGGGAAGAYLALQHWDAAALSGRIGKLAVAFSLSILVNLLVISVVQFDPLQLSRLGLVRTVVGLAIYFASMFAIFLLGGLLLAGAFSLWSHDSHRLYFADLLGASASTLGVSWLVQTLGGPGAIACVALLALAGGLLFGVRLSARARWLMPVIALGEVALLLFITLVKPIQLPVPQSKEYGVALSMLGVSGPEYTRWNPVGRVDVLPVISFNPQTYWLVIGGVSSTFTPAPHQMHFVTSDGTSITALHEFHGDLTPYLFLDHTLVSAPYQLAADHPQVLNIGVGGGVDILLARLHQAQHITAVELNSDVAALLTGPYADFTGHLADDPHTQIVVAEGRSYLTRSTQRYDIIQGIGVDNFAALSGGAYVLSESYLYTVEAMQSALSHLAPQGVFSWTRLVNNPPRESLRLAGLAAEALRRQGVTDPATHIAIVANEAGDTATLLVSPSPMAPAAVQRLRDWAAANHFQLLQDPYQRLNTVYADYLNAADPRAFEAAYAFNIAPTTDDNPFFYNYFKWQNLQIVRNDTGDINTRLPIGNFILLTMLAFALVAAVIFIAAPLARYRRRGLALPQARPMLLYFSLLGLGYIFVEVVLIQRFTLFIGYPTRAITTTIFSLLLFSAVGSLAARRLCQTSRQLRIVLLAAAAAILVYVVGLPWLLPALLPLPDQARTLLSVVIIAPLGFLMGMPFPTGLRQLSAGAQGLVPWAWGVNGVFSVIGSVLVILIGMAAGFSLSLTAAALFYALAAATVGELWQARTMERAAEPAEAA